MSKQRNLGILNRKQIPRKRQRTCAISRATCAARASSASCFCFSFASLSSVKPATAWVSLSHSFVGPTLPSLSKNTGRVGFELVLDIELVLDRAAGGCGEARPHRSPSHVGKPFNVSSPSLDCIPLAAATGSKPLRCRVRAAMAAGSRAEYDSDVLAKRFSAALAFLIYFVFHCLSHYCRNRLQVLTRDYQTRPLQTRLRRLEFSMPCSCSLFLFPLCLTIRPPRPRPPRRSAESAKSSVNEHTAFREIPGFHCAFRLFPLFL